MEKPTNQQSLEDFIENLTIAIFWLKRKRAIEFYRKKLKSLLRSCSAGGFSGVGDLVLELLQKEVFSQEVKELNYRKLLPKLREYIHYLTSLLDVCCETHTARNSEGVDDDAPKPKREIEEIKNNFAHAVSEESEEFDIANINRNPSSIGGGNNSNMAPNSSSEFDSDLQSDPRSAEPMRPSTGMDGMNPSTEDDVVEQESNDFVLAAEINKCKNEESGGEDLSFSSENSNADDGDGQMNTIGRDEPPEPPTGKTNPRKSTRESNDSSLVHSVDSRFRRFHIPFNDIIMGRTIGSGGFGTVMRGTLYSDSKTLNVAVKRLKFKVSATKLRKNLEAEIGALGVLKHPNIVKYYGYSEFSGIYYIITRFADGGDLRKLILSKSEKKKDLSLAQKLRLSLDIAEGIMYYYKKHGIVHRDIRPSNILVEKDLENGLYRACICDFGLARFSECFLTGRKTTIRVGYGPFIAPELTKKGIPNIRSDIFSFGMTVWSIFTQSFPQHLGPLDNFFSYFEAFESEENRNNNEARCIIGVKKMIRMCLRNEENRLSNVEIIIPKLKDALQSVHSDKLIDNDNFFTKDNVVNKSLVNDEFLHIHHFERSLIGTSFHNYKVVRLIGRGATCCVFEVSFLGVCLAMKIVCNILNIRSRFTIEQQRVDLQRIKFSQISQAARRCFEGKSEIKESDMNVFMNCLQEIESKIEREKEVLTPGIHTSQISDNYLNSEFIYRLPIHRNLLRIHYSSIGVVDKEQLRSNFNVDLGEYSLEKTCFFIMPLCNGTLLDILKKIESRPIFQEKEFFSFLSQIVSGLLVMKDNFVIHCDIKPNNLFYNISDSGNKVFLVGDFGCCLDAFDSRDFEISIFPGKSIKCGSAYYCPPEIIHVIRHPKRVQQVKYDKYDVYSLGRVCFELFSNRNVFPKECTFENRLTKLECKNEKIVNLIARMVADYDIRPSLEDLDKEIKQLSSGL